jgi:hypothetical protein
MVRIAEVPAGEGGDPQSMDVSGYVSCVGFFVLKKKMSKFLFVFIVTLVSQYI